MTTVFDIRYWRLAVVAASACLASALAGCADEGDGPLPMPEEGEVAEVPVTITFGTAWEQDGATRVPPPGQEADPDKIDGWGETKADKVRIVTFRRKDMDNQLQGGAVNDAPFTYDPTNDYVVDCEKDIPGENFKAEGTIRKIYGYEYRVVAIAYYSGRENAGRSNGVVSDTGEQNLFTLNAEDGTTFDDFKATVNTYGISDYMYDMNHGLLDDLVNNVDCLTRKMVFVPEFFYGYCVTESGNEIIKFAEFGDDGEYNKTIPLTGILYRGVAKIEVTLTLEPHVNKVLGVSDAVGERPINHAALLATNVNTVTGLSSYDDFLTPSVPVPTDGDAKYTIIDYKDAVENAGGRTVTFTAFVLPAKMELGIRFLTEKEIAVITCFGLFNGQIYVDDKTYNDGEGATGIISPDAQDNVFYFRRNHKYVLTGTSTSVLSHELD